MAAQPQVLSPGEYEEEDGAEVVLESTLTAYELAERSSQVSIARDNRRSLTLFRKELSEIARMSQPVAMEMMYSVPRAGKQLTGPSVRFAEAVLSCWGNCHAAVRIKDVSGDFIVAESAFYDAEKNARITIEVKRRITDKQGKRFNTDMIGVTGAAASSVALRGAILRGVPKALWADLFEQAKLTAAGDIQSLEKTRTEKIALFRALGVTDAVLLNALGVPGMADVGTDEIIAMAAWHKQLVAKECTLEDLFGSTDDAEIDSLMANLNWSEAQKSMARTNYKGRRSELLDYLRAQAKQAGEATGKVTAVNVKRGQTVADAAREQITDKKDAPKPETADLVAETSAAEKPAPAAKETAKEDW